MSELHTRAWRPIQDLPENWRETLVDHQTESLVAAWLEQADELRDKALYQQFLAKLQRQWAIETGVLENLYRISEGATLTLIEKGLDASLISHGQTDLDPKDVISKITDQHHAIMGLYQFVGGERPLGTSYIKELHCVLTDHQDTYVARDTLGNTVKRELPKGQWKTYNNHVEHPDGTRFEYCPYEHVSQEMDNLVRMHGEHEAAGVPAEVEAAWLHHRFLLIHPFVDGNGRVARCLATLVLLKAYWLPLVVTRYDRSDYIDSLRKADAGDLWPNIQLIGKLQRKAVREALSLTEEVIHESSDLDIILSAVKSKFDNRRAEQTSRIEQAKATADSLQSLAAQRLSEIAMAVSDTIEAEGNQFRAYMSEGKRGEEKSKYNYIQIINCAKQLGYFANLPYFQSWAALVIQTDHRTEILFSFHGIGHGAGVIG
ncbi:MAG: Fic family protein, partial [Planctomycetales bacterium]|nr:Fic family protein [Planctomycetales bacterium]